MTKDRVGKLIVYFLLRRQNGDYLLVDEIIYHFTAIDDLSDIITYQVITRHD